MTAQTKTHLSLIESLIKNVELFRKNREQWLTCLKEISQNILDDISIDEKLFLNYNGKELALIYESVRQETNIALLAIKKAIGDILHITEEKSPAVVYEY